ncbi:hypothetical protein Gotur_034914, partial [Gossypium turneri]
MNVILGWDVIRCMITNLLVLTTSLMPRKQFGKLLDFLKKIGVKWIFTGQTSRKKPPPGKCNQENDSDCCIEGKFYTTYKCSPPVSSHTKAKLTINSFEPGGDGGGRSECDNHYHSDDDPVVALSTGWFNHKKRCL